MQLAAKGIALRLLHGIKLAAMIILPECTYANDCTVIDLTPEQQFEIVT